MRRTWIGRLRTLAFAGAVLAGLGFGAQQAVASAGRNAAVGDCQPCPWPSQTECIECCKKLMFEDGLCTMSGSCICI